MPLRLWVSGKVWGIAPRAIIFHHFLGFYRTNGQADDLKLYIQIVCGVKNSSSMKPATSCWHWSSPKGAHCVYTECGVSSLGSVRKQVVNIPSFVVRLDSQKHIDFSLRSPYGGGRPGRVKRKNAKKGQGGSGGADDEEED